MLNVASFCVPVVDIDIVEVSEAEFVRVASPECDSVGLVELLIEAVSVIVADAEYVEE